jgi:hypothetical protein
MNGKATIFRQPGMILSESFALVESSARLDSSEQEV